MQQSSCSCRISLVFPAALMAGAVLFAQDFRPPKPQPVSPDAQKQIQTKIKKLRAALSSLQRQGLRDPWLSDIEVYQKAVTWVVDHNEFYTPATVDWTLEALDRGLLRAKIAASGEFPWVNLRGYSSVRAYRSKIDGSLQPYAVTFPKGYGNARDKKWRLDVVLHGRDKSLTEVKFLHRHNGDKEGRADNHVRLDIYGRGNNAYRWAGEADVLEAINHFLAVESKLGRANLLDTDRVVLRGFSMGGAGVWHIGLHMPDRWCVLGPGAGFTTTHGYVKGLPEKLPDYQERCLHIYDAVDYAENVFNVPVVAYAGSEDPQLQAAKNIERRLKNFSFADRMQLLTAPGLGHKFPSEWQEKAERAYLPYIMKGREEYPSAVRFVTYTMKYASCDWVEILGLEQHYQKALVDAEATPVGFTVKTQNVRVLHLTLPHLAPQEVEIGIDGQTVKVRPWVSQGSSFHVYLKKQDGRWKSVLPQRLITERARHPRKSAGLQGPIDDAFTDAFLCVKGTGQPWHQTTHEYMEADLARFEEEWSKFWRGALPVKNDIDVTDADIAGKHLILFGDPSSNSLIAQVLDGLPIQWTREKVVFGGKSFRSGDHVPVLIYPSPLNLRRYVVLNSGHTFHRADYEGTNALLYPRLGDYAVLHVDNKKDDALAADVVFAGLFDENWEFETQTKSAE